MQTTQTFSQRNPNPLAQVESEAGQLARQNFGAVVPGIYVDGSAVRLTKEQAFARALEANPEAYGRFRAQHNARLVVAALEAAGVRLLR